MSLKESVSEKLSRERHELVNIIESRYELLAELLSARVLTHRQLEELEETKTAYKRNDYIVYEGPASAAVYAIPATKFKAMYRVDK